MATQTTEPAYDSAPQAESHLWDYVHVLLRRRRMATAVFAAIVALATHKLTRMIGSRFDIVLSATNDLT